MDFKKALAASKKSIIAIIAIWIVVQLLGMVQMLGPIGMLLGMLQSFVLNPVLLAYSGYVIAKGMKGTLVDGAVAGVVTAAIAGLVTLVLTLVLLAIGVGSANAQGQMVAAGLDMVVLGLVFVAGVFSLAIMVIFGAVFGAVGAYLAGTGKK